MNDENLAPGEIRVLAHGILPKTGPITFRCRNCTAVFLCSRETARESTRTVGWIFKRSWPQWWMKCPTCSQDVSACDPDDFQRVER